MSNTELDRRISAFILRKQAEFPELAADWRGGGRTAKYARRLRSDGQVALT